jgi:hypothetical protein
MPPDINCYGTTQMEDICSGIEIFLCSPTPLKRKQGLDAISASPYFHTTLHKTTPLLGKILNALIDTQEPADVIIPQLQQILFQIRTIYQTKEEVSQETQKINKEIIENLSLLIAKLLSAFSMLCSSKDLSANDSRLVCKLATLAFLSVKQKSEQIAKNHFAALTIEYVLIAAKIISLGYGKECLTEIQKALANDEKNPMEFLKFEAANQQDLSFNDISAVLLEECLEGLDKQNFNQKSAPPDLFEAHLKCVNAAAKYRQLARDEN